MIRKHALVAAALLGGALVSAQAADFFAGASVGRSHYHVDDFPGVSIDRNDTGYKVFGGASFTPNFGLEAGYANLGKVKASAGGMTGSLRGTGFYVDAVGEFPVGGNFSLFGKIGAFRGEAKAEVPTVGSDKDTGTDVKFGFGGAYALNKNLSVRAEWERYRFNVFDDKGDTDLFSVGVSYKF
jgi:OOP family OmpA-OmpF porin